MKKALISGLFFVFAGLQAQSDMKKANDCYAKKDYDCSLKNYKKTIAAKSYAKKGYALVIQRIAASAYEIKDDKQAWEYLKKLEVTDSWPEYTQKLLMYTSYHLKNYPNVVVHGKKAMAIASKNSNESTYCFYTGEGYFFQKEYNDAITYYQKAINLNGTNRTAYFGVGDAYYQLKKYKKAEEWLKKALPLANGDDALKANIHYTLSKCEYDRYLYYGAETQINKALALDKKNYNYNWQAGKVNLKRKKYSLARNNFTYCLNQSTDKIDKRDATFNIGLTYENQGGKENQTKAIEFYKKALDMDPSYMKASNGLKKIYKEQGKEKELIPICEKALQNPEITSENKAETYAELSVLYADLGNSSKAETYAAKAIAVDPKTATPLSSRLAKLYVENKKWKDLKNLAITNMKYPSAKRYDSAKHLSYLALAEYKMGNSKKGHRYTEQSFKLSSYGQVNKADFLYYYCKNLLSKGDSITFKKFANEDLYNATKTLNKKEEKEWRKMMVLAASMGTYFSTTKNCLVKYEKLDSTDVEIKKWLMKSYAKNKSYKTKTTDLYIVKVLNSAILHSKSDKEKLEFLFQKAVILDKRKLPGQKATLEEMVRLKTEMTNIYYVLAFHYKNYKEYAKSNNTMALVYKKLTPEENSARSNFKTLEGINQFYLEDKVKSKAAFEAAKKFNPSNKDAQSWLDYLEKNK